MITFKQAHYTLPPSLQHLLTVILLFCGNTYALPSPEVEISATYYYVNSNGDEVKCTTSGHDSQSILQDMRQKGCTLDALQSQANINVDVTFENGGITKTVLMPAKYYLMWVGTGIHAFNLGRSILYVVSNLLAEQPVKSIGYFVASWLYYNGFNYYARDTLYPFLENNFPSYFEPSQKDNCNQLWSLREHSWVLIADLLMWGDDPYFIYGFDVNRLMVAVDLLNFVIGRFL